MRSRPDIDVKLSRSVLPGETLEVELIVVGRSVTPFERLDVHFNCHEAMSTPGREDWEIRRSHHATVTVAEKGELGEETYRFTAQFEVPEDVSPTYAGSAIASHAWVEVHLVIPWWFDLRERFDVTIAPAPVARPPAEPFTGSSLEGNEPFLELSLRAQSFAPGDTIEGAIAFGNLGGRTVTNLETTLASFERLPTGWAVDRETNRHTAFLAASSEREGVAIPFRLAVPASATPSRELWRGSVFWRLEVRLNLDGAPDVVYTVPVTITVFEGGARATSKQAAPIGEGRWRSVWAAAGEAAGLSLDPRRLQLRGTIADCEVRVKVGANEARGSSLVAELDWTSWGLDLALKIADPGALRALLPEDPRDRALKIDARDPEQASEILRSPLRRALLAFDRARITDAAATVRSDAPGYDEPWIGEFLARVEALATAIQEASRAVPAPVTMGGFLAAWQRFAADVDADLCVGAMAISAGSFEGADLQIRTEFEGKTPVATTIELSIDPPLDLEIDTESGEVVGRGAPLTLEVFRSIARLCGPILDAGDALPRPARAPTPKVTPTLVTIRLPVVIASPASLRELMSALLSLVASMRGDSRSGPYR